eukprot:GHVU01004504.1.p1 GENE.GHVU01004504.1~~GHVU01004504.1.p1  ORF type:complete len:401 (-),score=51.92 GHVU01004504.1:243-1445(-)
MKMCRSHVESRKVAVLLLRRSPNTAPGGAREAPLPCRYPAAAHPLPAAMWRSLWVPVGRLASGGGSLGAGWTGIVGGSMRGLATVGGRVEKGSNGAPKAPRTAAPGVQRLGGGSRVYREVNMRPVGADLDSDAAERGVGATASPTAEDKGDDQEERGNMRCWEITLDGRPIRSNSGRPLLIPSRKLAAGVVAEFEAQEGTVKPHTMHLTALAFTYSSRSSDPLSTIAEVKATLLSYFDCEGLCYRSDEGTPLRAMQDSVLTPITEAFARQYGVQLPVATGFAAPDLPPETRDYVRRRVQSMGVWDLVALEAFSSNCHSVALGLLLLDSVVTPEAAISAAQVELSFQQRRWGVVEGVHDVAEAEALESLRMAQVFVAASPSRADGGKRAEEVPQLELQRRR